MISTDAAAQIGMDHWSQGRVVLVGDAGYASPMSGQGTSLALIGAYVLAGELAAASGAYQTAFRQYEEEMRPFVMVNQELGRKAANLMGLRRRKCIRMAARADHAGCTWSHGRIYHQSLHSAHTKLPTLLPQRLSA